MNAGFRLDEIVQLGYLNMECMDIQKNRGYVVRKLERGSPCIERRVVVGKASHECKPQGICFDDLHETGYRIQTREPFLI